MKLQKVRIEIISGSRAGTVVPVLFNPEQYTMDKANSFKSTAVPGLGSELIQFVNGNSAILTMELFLEDSFDGPSLGLSQAADELVQGVANTLVMARMKLLNSLLEIDRMLHAPPTIRFVWGPLRFDAVVEKITSKVTIFHSNGLPKRASLSVSFREYRSIAQQLEEPRRESADKTKRRQVDAAETLWLIAEREYGDTRAWRHIAEESDVDDPRALRPGDWLQVPPLEDGDGLRRAR
ncbi:MAG TPA: LysM peptidoglycan-binding domain-containing protein [Allosphingosinicella sp.]|nr:LysM peptidoglycan-binding domain-containing protein [Allosphingosinicella sp.]